MKNRTLHAPKRHLAILVFALIIIIILQSGCQPPAAPLGGIAVETFETIFDIGESDFPVPNVPNAGNVLPGPNGWQILGPGTGSDLSFSGITDPSGTSAYPNARTNARWQVSAGPSIAPPCAQGFDTENVPTAGMTFQFFCVTLF
jgi:hypothetical protein